jgi:hypothetical protein
MHLTKTLLFLMSCAVLMALSSPALAIKGDNFTLFGTVTDANWNPVQNATVTLYDNNFVSIATNTTDTSGNFMFSDMNVSTYTCTIRVQVVQGGTTHIIPDYYFSWFNADGIQRVDSNETHYEDYYVPGSVPRVSPSPTMSPTILPTITPMPTATPDPASPMSDILFGAGGFIAGAAIATLACFILLRHPGKR